MQEAICLEKMSTEEMMKVVTYLQKQYAELLREKKELQLSRDKYFSIYNFAPAGCVVVDANGIIIDTNQTMCALFGSHQDNLLGRELITCITDDTRDEYVAHIQNLVEKGTRQECIVKIARDNGEAIYVKLESDYLSIEEGVYRQCSVFLDITKCKNLEGDLKKTIAAITESNTELERFSYIASHDLREPLHSISSCAQLLDLKYKSILDESGKKLINYILEASGQMNSLIVDLLFYSNYRYNSGFFTQVDSSGILNYVLKNLQGLINEKNAIVTSKSLPVIYADSTQVAQLFQNLIGNAIKHHSGADIRISVCAKQEGGVWLFAVKDNGCGIEAEYLQKIFEVFKRLEPRTKSSGTGIGLAICKQVVEKHGGRIWAESTLGEGSTFYFTLPVKQE